MYSDWLRHSDSDTEFAVGVSDLAAAAPAQPGGGASALTVRKTLNGAFKRMAYLNQKLGSVSGVQELSFAVKFPAGVDYVSAGCLLLWDGNDLDGDRGLMLEVSGALDGTHALRLRKGPGEDGAVLAAGGAVSNANWWQFVIQLRFDEIRNTQARVYRNDATANGYNTPVWVQEFAPLSFPRGDLPFGGKVAFFVSSRKDVFDVLFDQIHVTSVPTF